jgi:Trk K+ transport system NAD-binding subunit
MPPPARRIGQAPDGMKYLPTLVMHYVGNRAVRRNLTALGKYLLLLVGLTCFYTVLFHYLMAWEQRQYTWVTGFYWTLTVMSTLGFGDITFQSDAGRAFSIVVLLSGTLFMLILLPFTFIQFFYAPWVEAQAAARAPRELPSETSGHVVLTRYGPVDTALIAKLRQYHYPYVVLVPDVPEALRLRDLDIDVVVGATDDPDTYRRVRIDRAALVATTHSDVVNTNVAFTVREMSPQVPIVATALESVSVDILELAGCNRVLQLAEAMGRAMARRVTGRDAKTHVIGQFESLLIAEASAANTPLVGRTLRDIRLPDHVSLNVVGVWERGRFQAAGPETRIQSSTILVLAGTRAQLDDYDSLFCIYHASEKPVVILGGGRVGRATARSLAQDGIDYRIVEKLPERVADKERLVVGDAADLEVLERAGIAEAPAVVITTHDDDMNVYLTIYCRRLRQDIQIISRATLERNINTLHRAGADFVLSYASMGANAIFNLLRRSNILLLAEGLDVFQMMVPESLAGKSLAETGIRNQTQSTVIAIDDGRGIQVNPSPQTALPPGGKMILIGTAEAEEAFLRRYVSE